MNKKNLKMTIYFQNKKQKKKYMKRKNLIKLMEEIFKHKKLLMNNQKMILKKSKNDHLKKEINVYSLYFQSIFLMKIQIFFSL